LKRISAYGGSDAKISDLYYLMLFRPFINAKATSTINLNLTLNKYWV